MGIRDELIAAGLLTPARPERPGDPTPEPERDLTCLEQDDIGRRVAAKTIANPPSEERALKDLRNGRPRLPPVWGAAGEREPKAAEPKAA